MCIISDVDNPYTVHSWTEMGLLFLSYAKYELPPKEVSDVVRQGLKWGPASQMFPPPPLYLC